MSRVAAEPRRRSAADSRERLLVAAGELFAERGYDSTTVREVGHRADVDPALIARYFGSKSALYLASLRRSGQPANIAPMDVCDPTAVEGFLDRVAADTPTPSLFAVIQPHEDTELQSAAMDILGRRVVDPARHTATAADLDQPQLRAEMAMAALTGIVLSRKSGALDALSAASSADVAQLVGDVMERLLRG